MRGGGGGGIRIPPKNDDVIYEQTLTQYFLHWPLRGHGVKSKNCTTGRKIAYVCSVLTMLTDFCISVQKRILCLGAGKDAF